jgi:exopolysaccharide biosynthesis polyprenyl glycosylphosphotransferase
MIPLQGFPTSPSWTQDFFRPEPEVSVGNAEAADAGSRLEPFLNAAERALDFLVVTLAVYSAYALYRLLGAGRQAQYAASAVLVGAAAFAALFVVLLERRGGYRIGHSLLAVRETERILRVTLESFLLTLLLAYLSAVSLSRLVIAFTAITVPIFVMLEKWEAYHAMRILRSKGFGARRAVILGAGTLGRRVYSALVRSPKFGLDPVAFVDDDPQKYGLEIYESSYQHRHPVKVMAGPVCPELLHQLNASVLVMATADADRDAMMSILAQLSAAGVNTYFVPKDFSEPGYWIDYAELDGVMLAHLSKARTGFIYGPAKRLLDVAGAAVCLALLAPVLCVIAALVKFTSLGPVLFRQNRVGKDGRLFPMYKFRTMFLDAPHYAYSPKRGDDPHITPVGRFLRKTSLDELPQILNVLLGDMSLVGPRPEMPFIVEQYTPLQRQRLSVKPGITGLWQLSADRAFLIHENIEYDLYYLTNNPKFLWDIGLQFSGLRRFEIDEC